MFEIGQFVSFFNKDENFEHLNLELLEDFIEDCSWYEIVELNQPTVDFIIVRSLGQERNIPALIADYKIHTKESLRKELKQILNSKKANKEYSDVCNKIIQLYRKHNRTDSQFKFQGV